MSGVLKEIVLRDLSEICVRGSLEEIFLDFLEFYFFDLFLSICVSLNEIRRRIVGFKDFEKLLWIVNLMVKDLKKRMFDFDERYIRKVRNIGVKSE